MQVNSSATARTIGTLMFGPDDMHSYAVTSAALSDQRSVEATWNDLDIGVTLVGTVGSGQPGIPTARDATAAELRVNAETLDLEFHTSRPNAAAARR